MFHVEQGRRTAERWLIEGAQELGIVLTDQQVADFCIYLNLLIRWNQKINLTAVRETKAIIVKHFLDSLMCGKALPFETSGSLLDVGSGAGFPGLPLKIMNPDLDVILLEPSQKKIAFLRHVIGTLRLRKVSGVSKRIQDLAREPRYLNHFAQVITRALRPELILPFLRPILAERGRIILCRVKPLGAEPARQSLTGLAIAKEIAYCLPYGYGSRVLTVLQSVDLG